MKLVYTFKARSALREIANFLKQNHLASSFIVNYLEETRADIRKILTTFPEIGSKYNLEGFDCRKVVVRNYSVLYSYDSKQQLIKILFIYKQNLPSLK